ncbi:MAG: hypothetical protein HY319_16395 [Armatimonadetes bacterium]|nr:hypothetical protein [Armatimonadota bacterium]
MAPSIENQPSAEELIVSLREENRALKEQLSGTDLKVFEQIRELRSRNKKQTDEIRRLTAECVQLAFRVRELETQVEEAQSQAQSFQSQETELSGQLHDQLRSYEESIEQIRRESQADRESLESRFVEREQALLMEMQSRDEQISSLETTIAELKEQFLSAESVEELEPASVRDGIAFQILVGNLEELLGFSGRTLVEQVYFLCRAEADTEDTSLLEDIFEALQDTGAKLVRNQEQEAALTATLERSWKQVMERLGREVSTAAAPAEELEVEPHWIEPAGPGIAEQARAVEAAPVPVESPRGEAPVAEAPRVEVPATEPPRVEVPAGRAEAPAAEPPQVAVPATEPPRVEVPAGRAEAPATEAPRVEVPATEPPRVEVPAGRPETPATEPPRAEVPAGRLEAPAPEPPRVEVPAGRPEAPATEPPRAEVPAGRMEAPAPEPPRVEVPAGRMEAPAPEPPRVEVPAGRPEAPATEPPRVEVPAAEPPVNEPPRVATPVSLVGAPVAETVPGRLEPPPTETAPEPPVGVELGTAEFAGEERAVAAEEPPVPPFLAAQVPGNREPHPVPVPMTEPEGDLAIEPEPEPAVAAVPETEEPPPAPRPALEEPAIAVEDVIELEEEPEEAAPPAPATEPQRAPAPPADVSLENAGALLEEGEYEEAEAQFRALLRDEPESPEYQFGMMRACVGVQQWEEAHRLGLELAKRQHEWDEETREQVNLIRLEAIQAKIQNPRSEVEVKELLLEVAEMKLPSPEAVEYLDEAEKIPVRIEGEGRLSFHRVALQADVADVSAYLLDYMHQLGDRPDLFGHIEKVYAQTEFAPMAGAVLALARLPRSQAEARVATLLGPNPATKAMVEAIGDAGEEALVEVFLDHLIPRAGVELPLPSRRFQRRLQQAEPAAFVGSLRQALRHVNYTIFFDQIEVLSYAGTDSFLVDAAPVPTPTLLFHKSVEEVPPEELRFLVFRRLVQIFRRHLHLYHLAEAFDDTTRDRLIQACVQMHLDSEYEISEVLMYEVEQITRAAAHRPAVESLLWKLYEHTGSDNFLDLADFMYEDRLMKKWLDPLADHFAAQVVGLAPASYATAREHLRSDPLYARIEAEGFQVLYAPEAMDRHSDLRLRLQRLWMGSLKPPAES